MKNIWISLLIIINSTIGFSQTIEGKWKFQKIYNTSDSTERNVKPVSDKDFMLLKNNGSFIYNLNKIKLFAEGKWEIENNILILQYKSPNDTTRKYKFEITNNELILQEADILFKFNKVSENNTQSFYLNKILRGVLGLITLIIIAFAFSKRKNNIDWNLVWKGLLIQFVFAFCILKIPIIHDTFEWLSLIFITILNFTREGSIFLFGGFIEDIDSYGYIFAFQVLPTIVFFSALTSLLFYYKILQRIIYVFAFFMKKTLNLSGPESLAAAGNIFLGQTESPLLVKPYINNMTTSELLCLMSGGMATIAGGVLAAYIGFLGGNDPQSQLFFAKHLLAASVMSAPAAVICAKILMPENEKVNQNIDIPKEDIGKNALEAISIGTTQGLKLAVNVGAMLLVFIAFISMTNYFLENFLGDITGINKTINNITEGQYSGLSLEFILGYIFAPLTWLMGVCKEDMILVGQLLGEKTILNEFVAYVSLGEMKNNFQFTEEKSIIIATYILCGFANFASIGIQIGGIGVLAPKRRTDLSKLGILALIAGTLASLFTAIIVSIII